MGIAGILVGVLVALGFLGYILLMIYYPEWVGITGKAEREQFKEREKKAQGDGPVN